jgi:hypothetical protein
MLIMLKVVYLHIFGALISLLLVVGLGGQLLASGIDPDELKDQLKKGPGLPLSSARSEVSVKERAQLFQNLGRFSPPTSNKRQVINPTEGKKPLSLAQEHKGPKELSRSKSAFSLPVHTVQKQSGLAEKDSKSDTAQATSPRSSRSRILQKLKSPFTERQETKQETQKDKPLRVKGKAGKDSMESFVLSAPSINRVATRQHTERQETKQETKQDKPIRVNGKADKGSMESCAVSAPSINEAATRQHIFALASIEQKLSENIRRFEMVDKTIQCHLEIKPNKKPTIDPTDEKYLYVLQGDLRQLQEMYVKGLSYLKGEETLKRYDTPEKLQRLAEEIANQIRNMANLLEIVGKEIFWVTGTGTLTLAEISLFEKKLADAKQHLTGGRIETAGLPRITHPARRGQGSTIEDRAGPIRKSPGSAISGKATTPPPGIRGRAHTEGAALRVKPNSP